MQKWTFPIVCDDDDDEENICKKIYSADLDKFITNKSEKAWELDPENIHFTVIKKGECVHYLVMMMMSECNFGYVCMHLSMCGPFTHLK